VPKPLLSYLLPYSERSIALVKRLVHQKELKLIPTCPTLTKVLPPKHTHFIYIDGLFSRTKQSAVIFLFLFHIPERSIALVKRLAGSPKGAEIDPNLPHANC
jgi:hypothetical protein